MMIKLSSFRIRVVVVLAGAAALALVGCSGALISNLTEESQSNISVLLINNTDFRASFTIGAFDDFDRNPPGQVSFQQPRVEAHTSAAPINFGCFRDVAIGSDKLLTRILATDGDDMANFDPDTFVTGVNFSTAPLGSDGAALPDAGKGGARTVRLGVDYGCDDQLIFTFEQNDDGTFRIDYSVVVNARGDE